LEGVWAWHAVPTRGFYIRASVPVVDLVKGQSRDQA